MKRLQYAKYPFNTPHRTQFPPGCTGMWDQVNKYFKGNWPYTYYTEHHVKLGFLIPFDYERDKDLPYLRIQNLLL